MEFTTPALFHEQPTVSMKIIAFFVNGGDWPLDGVTPELADEVYRAEDLIAAVLLAYGDDFGPPITRLEVETAAGNTKTFDGRAERGKMGR